jgi:hypothetical protein
VAVAYFGQGASKLLPLPPHSRLVVDASDRAVSSGQTSPADLKKMQRHGVIVYSLPYLHAKIYAFDKIAFIGSANASNNAANTLIESMISTTDASVVRSARQFVRELCLNEMTPETLDELQKKYRPPRFNGKKNSSQRIKHLKLPRLMLVQTYREDLPKGSETAEADGLRVAKTKQKYERYEIDKFWWPGKCPFQTGDKVVEVHDEGRGKLLVSPPGNVVHTRQWSNGKQNLTFIFYEYPNLRRVRLERLARRIGYGAKKRLSGNGLIRNRAFAEKLFAAFGG